MTTTQRIAEYLILYGRMSGSDICDDLGVDCLDVEEAVRDGEVAHCTGVLGGSAGPWFRSTSCWSR